MKEKLIFHTSPITGTIWHIVFDTDDWTVKYCAIIPMNCKRITVQVSKRLDYLLFLYCNKHYELA